MRSMPFGRYFVSNPDLPKRIELGLPLNDDPLPTAVAG
jgi:2,4-dienoyl-CoA reductase-like NADH-dependent reductase (Old Yellow Enzyme family)